MPTIFVRFIDNHRVAGEPANEMLYRTGDVIEILPFGHVLTAAEEAGKAQISKALWDSYVEART